MAGTAIITGSSRGIGAAIAKRLAKDGYNIVINDVSQEILDAAGKEVAEECRSFGVEAECYAADVSDYAQCEGLVKWVKERFGTIDVLINNAGITRDGLMAQMSEENYDLVIRVNQKSVFNMTKLAGKVMIRQRSGRIVNLASVAGLYGNPGADELLSFQGRYNRDDEDHREGAGQPRYHLQCGSTGIHSDPDDRQAHRGSAQCNAGSDRYEALRSARGDRRRGILPVQPGFFLRNRTDNRNKRRTEHVIKFGIHN